MMEDSLHLPVRQANRRTYARHKLLSGVAGLLAILLLAAFFAQISFAASSAGHHATELALMTGFLDRRLPQPPQPSTLLRAISAFALLFFLGGALVSPLFRRPKRGV
jgi:hypothetical protein